MQSPGESFATTVSPVAYRVRFHTRSQAPAAHAISLCRQSCIRTWRELDLACTAVHMQLSITIQCAWDRKVNFQREEEAKQVTSSATSMEQSQGSATRTSVYVFSVRKWNVRPRDLSSSVTERAALGRTAFTFCTCSLPVGQPVQARDFLPISTDATPTTTLTY